ncbi:flavin reductase family protein [Amycolatopsis azurea]|uniref:Flavin reductase n=1 Tax=Amycolatopsis azurea DSM 43854 TaxID=1238180 RepID=M2PUH8_9PSEU|nr:flavin reductase family protein [Amycolatopsis azurea]EMD28273.1 NADH-FMN oxidoreductase [Amycolatopsis azurea DSM 43854]OOC00786.1 flavin reductase [Amycolatopsis azurea DSM 43854]
MPVLAEDFTRAMTRVPGPVTVVTTADESGRRWGFTGTSFSSLSLDPPLVLVCLGKKASTHHAFTTASRFLINVLGRSQEGVASRFATSGVDRFGAGDAVPVEHGLPGLPQAVARLSCSTHSIQDGGDHSILIGLVEAVHVGDGDPLVYVDRSFTRPEPR